MKDADRIRVHGREKYVLPARRGKLRQFSIRAGDVVHELGISGRAPSVCSALKSREFLERNNLQLVDKTGPKSGQSTTVTYTYEFVGNLEEKKSKADDAFMALRGIGREIFASLGGGEAFLRRERAELSRAVKDREREVERSAPKA